MDGVREPMRLLSSVPRAAIDDAIGLARHPGHDPARWALPLLDALDGPGVSWSLVELDTAEYAALWLPGHAGEACHGDTLALGSPEGGTVAMQAAWLDRHAKRYAAANPSCWGRVEAARLGQPTPVVVADRSVGDRVKPHGVPWVVVDGYHRALGYWRAGRRTLVAHLPSRPASVVRSDG